MSAPLAVDLLLTGTGGAGVVSLVVFLFRHPDKIGGWFPKLQTSWYNGRLQAEKARRAYKDLRDAQAEMRELER
ncbi:hypothetical protein ACIBF6_37290 [Streptosporangium amethystogenes]|uniref:hypothetical protein n=1 Tax=Streptosporangium amethystogenes TaxID=2002 RepID=UPI0037AFBC68